MTDRITLWRLTWSHAKGAHWIAMCACPPELAESWKGIYESDDAQGVVYAIAKRVPKLPASARANWRDMPLRSDILPRASIGARRFPHYPNAALVRR